MDPTILGSLGLGAAVLNFLLVVNVFARKEDVEKLRADIATYYVLKSELTEQLKAINNKLDTLFDYIHGKG